MKEEELKKAAYNASNTYEEMQKFIEGAEWADEHTIKIPKSKLSFSLSDKECDRYETFKKDHFVCKGRTSIIITPTGIGNSVQCRCNGCGVEKDITDIDSW